jgi:subtilase family serine protease
MVEAVDLGPTSGSDIETVSLGLNVHNEALLEAYVQATVTTGSPFYHQWLTVPQFTALYSPKPEEIADVTRSLLAAGITVVSVSDNRLVIRATGTVDAFNAYFATTVHDYSKAGAQFHAPAVAPTIPWAISGTVLLVSGLSTEKVLKSHALAAPFGPAQAPVVLPSSGGIATGVPGDYTVGDVANFYNINPLYAAGYLGQRRTIDVEQSGGLAPQADIIVYEAPNTDGGFIDLFVSALCDNKVDTLSISWGEPELAATPGLPYFLNLTFLEAAAQGISVFASSGDAGAYDLNGYEGWPYGQYSDVLTVDLPASAPYMTGAGGLTVPFTLQLGEGDFSGWAPGVVVVPSVRAWAWDYLQDYLNENYGSAAYYEWGFFPVGGGGGVSLVWGRPWYQNGVRGVKTSTAQSLLYYPDYPVTSPVQDWADLPGGYAGRNVPDVSLNADPYTGYLVYYQGGWQDYWGGTSFVAPQLNGIFSLINQEGRTRLGFLNPALYQLSSNQGCDGGHFGQNPRNVAVWDVTSGDNLFYNAVPGYDPATGVGSLDVANFAAQLLGASRSH